MRHTHWSTWNMARNLKNMEQETNTLQELEYGEKTDQKDLADGNKTGKQKKFRKSQDRTWNMVKNTEKLENEKHTLQDLEYGEKTDQKGK